MSTGNNAVRVPDFGDTVCCTLSDHVLMIQLSSPDTRNALSIYTMSALQNALDFAKDTSDVRVVIISALGSVFSAGHNLKEMQEERTQAEFQAIFEQCSRLMHSVVMLPKPVIAQVEGLATAAGCQLVASCDLVYCDDHARFATPGVHIGLFCSTPMVALSRAVGRKAAMEMLLTGMPIDAQKAKDIGLVNDVLPSDELQKHVRLVAKHIAGKSALTLKVGKKAFYQQLEMPLADAYAYASAVMADNMMAKDAKEGIAAFVEKRQPKWADS
jgi:enoyl-CoA hydratase/carnithine racemase